MAEIWFYHLERQSLDDVLPVLLARTLERGWRAVVQAGNKDRLEAIDSLLWTHTPDSFLPHAMKRDGNAERQPIYLGDAGDNPNGASVRFYVEGAPLTETDGYERIVYLFDGVDPSALDQARADWKKAKASEHATTYWRQDETGRWTKQNV